MSVRPLAAGEMKWKVKLFDKGTPARTADGGESITWIEIADVWAKKVDLRGRKFFAADKIQISVDIEVRIRRLVGIAAEMRLTLDDQPYDIVEVIDADAADRHLQLICVKGVRDGR
jgi:SPP1 family predicted phage head-tail adaptor